MSPTRFHCATLLLPTMLKKIFLKNLLRPGVEPESLWPQHNVLTARPPKHTIFIVPFLQSYWDWLPVEIQDYILSFVWWQSMRDHRNPLKENLLREIRNYHALKIAWNQPPVVHGHILITHHRSVMDCPNNNINNRSYGYGLYCFDESCTMSHSCIWALYTIETGQYEVFLGHNFPSAFDRVNDSLTTVERHLAREIRNRWVHDNPYGIFWSFWAYPYIPHPVGIDARPTSIFSSNRVIGLGYR